jgi:4-hydroxy-2-oxoheptanedioate aldolase
MRVPDNRFKRALAERRPQIGLWSQLTNNVAAEILARAGFDWIVVDTEHAPNEPPGVLVQLQVLAASETAPVVRVAWNDAVLIKRLLDIGAQSLLVPYVETEDDARRAVAHTRYPPAGVRGVATNHRANQFGRIGDYLATAASQLCLLVQIETRRGLDNAGAIAAVDGIDGVFVGPSDLAASLGHLGDVAHPAVQEAIAAIHARAARAGKPTGILAPAEADARRFADMGFTFIAVGSDVALLARNADALAAKYGDLRARPARSA